MEYDDRRPGQDPDASPESDPAEGDDVQADEGNGHGSNGGIYD